MRRLGAIMKQVSPEWIVFGYPENADSVDIGRVVPQRNIMWSCPSQRLQRETIHVDDSRDKRRLTPRETSKRCRDIRSRFPCPDATACYTSPRPGIVRFGDPPPPVCLPAGTPPPPLQAFSLISRPLIASSGQSMIVDLSNVAN